MLQLPQPRVGLDLGVPGQEEQLIGRNQGRAVMDEGTSPGAGGRCRAVRSGSWVCAGLCPSYSWSTMQHLEGLGVLVPSQKGEGGSGHAACRRQ